MTQSQVHESGDSPVASIEEFTTTPFDFIVCGGGTAGLAIAARLSEISNVNVGIVEAGKYRIGDPLIETPATFMQMFEDPEYDWCLFTAPQEANNGKVHHIPRGKVLGGSSAINYLMYVRGSLQDYDDWAALVGDEGWSAANMKAYMRKHQARNTFANPSYEISLTLPFLDPRTGQSRVQGGSISHRP
jgi:choline dehydrogenase-like flavoprotein